MLDTIFATISILMLIGFMAVVVWFVAEPDLTIVVVVVLAMGVYDFWRTLRQASSKRSNGE